jgi:nucleotide-binding universal stress UspA family protein
VKEVGKLLYATDIMEPSFSEVEGVLALRTLGLKEVILLHTTKVEDWETRLANRGMNSKTVTVDGSLVPAILNVADREAISLVAANLKRDKRRPLRGSLTMQLLRASTLPVLILPEGAQASESMEKSVFTRLVFATDWSPSSGKALSYLLSLSLKTITETLEIVHVIDKKLSVRDMSNINYKLRESRKIFLDHEIDAEGHVYAGKASEEIMLAARDYDATCIVMGTTGKSAVKDLFSPSCSYRVAEESVVPTLVVP